MPPFKRVRRTARTLSALEVRGRDKRRVSANIREISVHHRDIFPGYGLDFVGGMSNYGRQLFRQTSVSTSSRMFPLDKNIADIS